MAPVIFDPKVMPKRVNQAAGEDLVLTSACNYYDGVTQQEAEAFYSAMKDPKDETPVSYGLNSRLVKENGKIQEKVWKDTLEEEMRILYVAMTRAKRKLILTGTIKAQDLEAGLRLQINTQKWRVRSWDAGKYTGAKMACRKYDGLDSSGYGRTISKYR